MKPARGWGWPAAPGNVWGKEKAKMALPKPRAATANPPAFEEFASAFLS